MFFKIHRLVNFFAIIVCLATANTAISAESITPRAEPFHTNFNQIERENWYISNGWRNGGHQNCTWSRRAIGLEPRKGLILRYMPEGDGLDEALCGEIQTRMWFKYGTFETRYRADGGSGRNAAFFAFTGAVHGQPHDEIDFEMLTREPDLLWINRYVGGNDFGAGEEKTFAPDQGGYVDVAFVWEPDRLRWYINGELVREETDGIPTHAMKIYFSHWGSNSFPNWMGRFAEPDGTVEMNVSSFTYTPLGDDCVSPESIVCGLK